MARLQTFKNAAEPVMPMDGVLRNFTFKTESSNCLHCLTEFSPIIWQSPVFREM